MAEAYALNKELNDSISEEDLKNLRRKLDEEGTQEQETKHKRYRQTLIG